MAPSVPFPAQCSVRREIPFSPVCSKSPAVEHPQQSHWSPALSDMAGLDEMGRQQLQLALKLPCSFFTSQASGGGPLTPCGIGGRGWRGAEHSPGILPTNSCFSLKKKINFYSHKQGMEPAPQGVGSLLRAPGIFLKGQRMCSFFWLGASKSANTQELLPLMPNLAISANYSLGLLVFFFFLPRNNVIKNKNTLTNKNLRLVFLRIYKDGVYCC